MAINSQNTTTVPIFKPRPDSLFQGYAIDPDFRSLDWGDWDYNRRREAQAILPFLFLGPTTVAKDVPYLQAAGITMTLVVRHARQNQFPGPPAASKVADRLGIPCLVLDIYDNQALSHNLFSALDAINLHLSSVKARTGTLGKVLLTDDTGNERAAAIVVAYIMAMTDFTLVPAIQFAQAQRFCINIDDALRHTLQAFADILQAHSDVGHLTSTLQQPSITAGRPKEKRTHGDMVQDDHDHRAMDIDDPQAIIQSSRRDFTPFVNG